MKRHRAPAHRRPDRQKLDEAGFTSHRRSVGKIPQITSAFHTTPAPGKGIGPNPVKRRSARDAGNCVISRLSGSGKSTVLQNVEDLGFYCVDNSPSP